MKNPYLYLEKREYAETWVSGGKIPIKLASCYRKDERSGIYTPDENIISSFPTPTRSWEWLLQKTGNAKDGGNINTIISMHPFTGEKIEMKWSDGYILSFCTIKCSKVMQKLDKKICVQINDIFKLKKCIDEQMNCIGEYQRCKYTQTHQRNHFLKSKDDEWQQEYRIFWNTTICTEQVWVDIQKNTAHLCKF